MQRYGMRSPAWAGLCLLISCAATGAAAQLVINEFLADPEGSDGGREFVELLNTSAVPVDLGGWQLQFANGAEGPVWQTRWSGVPGHSLDTGARFLIVDRNWAGVTTGDVEVALALQNGPDAIRLVHAGQPADVVGYGPLTDGALMETAPAPLAAGRATARRPDGRDSGNNAADFVTAAPTPGAPNFERLLLAATEIVVEPPSAPWPGEMVSVEVTLRNDGLEALPLSRVRLEREGEGVEAMLDAMAPGDTRRLVFALRPVAPGLRPFEVRCRLSTVGDSLRVLLGGFQVGPAELCLNEVLGAPRDGQGEWVELEAGTHGAVDLGGYRLRDADGGWVRLPPLTVSAGGLALVAQDSSALAAWLAGNASGPEQSRGCDAVPMRLSGWPSLNNSAPDGRAYADRVLLADSTGAVIDHVTLPEAAAEAAGRSLERVASSAGSVAWVSSLAAAGSTPGCRNSVSAPLDAPPPGVELSAIPTAVDRAAGAAAVHLRFMVPGDATGWDLAVFDLDGRRVRDLGGDRAGAGLREILWDLRDDRGRAVTAGGYVAVLRLAAVVGQGWAPSRLLLAVR
jgi:hypothetical protein